MSFDVKTYITHLDSKIGVSRAAIVDLKVKLDEDPANALSWSLDAFEHAGRLRVLTVVKSALEKGRPIEVVLAHCRKEALRGAVHPRRSTSQTDNLMAQYITAAWADIVDSFDLEAS
jgi:hypothetical protein